MRIALLSHYELGHQPVHLASPAGALRAEGHEVRTLDLAVESWDDDTIRWAEIIGFSVPMHTALRLAIVAAERINSQRPDVPLVAFGLYATMQEENGLFARQIGGEYIDELIEWIAMRARGEELGGASTNRQRGSVPAVDRSGLAPLHMYARLAYRGEERLVGAVETTHGCRHACRHCPLPAVYDGRFFAVARDAVLSDIAALVEMGAEHITFADADFLNGPSHSLRIVEEMHRRWPELTFDATIKVEHLLTHAQHLPRLAEAGCLFIVSAFETMNDDILSILDKGHTAEDAARAIHLVRRHGIDLRPTWLPFTPWTSLDDIAEIFSFIASHDLVASTDPVQLSIRLLVPARSLLADHPRFLPHRGQFNDALISYEWRSPDPRVDELAEVLARLAESRAGEDPAVQFAEMWNAARLANGDEQLALIDAVPSSAIEGRPRLTEPWFC